MKTKLILVLTAIIFICQPAISQDDWTHISTPGVHFLMADQQTSYRYYNETVGSHGMRYNLFKSTDGSYSFSLIKTKTGDFGCYSIDELFVTDPVTVFYSENCQGSTVIYKTTDGGDTWINTGMGGAFSMAMYFLRQDYGYYSFYPGAPNYSYLLRNGTIVLTTQRYILANGYPSANQRTEIYFKNDSTGMVMCRDSLDNSVIIYSGNYGNDWIEQITVGGAYFNDIHFINDTVGFIVGTYGLLMKTNDFGENWDFIETGISEDLNFIDFSPDGIGYIAASNGQLYKSSDMGETWENVSFPNGLDLVYVRVFDDENVYVLDEDGQLFYNHDETSIVDRQLPHVNAYPNPVKSFLILSGENKVSIDEARLYDIQGRMLLKTYSGKIDFRSFEKGVYLLEIITENGNITKRILKQ